MLTTKRILLVGFIAIQTFLIILLGVTAIVFRNEGIKAKAEANYYHEELKASHEDNEAKVTRSLVKKETI